MHVAQEHHGRVKWRWRRVVVHDGGRSGGVVHVSVILLLQSRPGEIAVGGANHASGGEAGEAVLSFSTPVWRTRDSVERPDLQTFRERPRRGQSPEAHDSGVGEEKTAKPCTKVVGGLYDLQHRHKVVIRLMAADVRTQRNGGCRGWQPGCKVSRLVLAMRRRGVGVWQKGVDRVPGCGLLYPDRRRPCLHD
jgi:hypothetical protein